jgi:hypothetical protein
MKTCSGCGGHARALPGHAPPLLFLSPARRDLIRLHCACSFIVMKLTHILNAASDAIRTLANIAGKSISQSGLGWLSFWWAGYSLNYREKLRGSTKPLAEKAGKTTGTVQVVPGSSDSLIAFIPRECVDNHLSAQKS